MKMMMMSTLAILLVSSSVRGIRLKDKPLEFNKVVNALVDTDLSLQKTEEGIANKVFGENYAPKAVAKREATRRTSASCNEGDIFGCTLAKFLVKFKLFGLSESDMEKLGYGCSCDNGETTYCASMGIGFFATCKPCSAEKGSSEYKKSTPAPAPRQKQEQSKVQEPEPEYKGSSDEGAKPAGAPNMEDYEYGEMNGDEVFIGPGGNTPAPAPSKYKGSRDEGAPMDISEERVSIIPITEGSRFEDTGMGYGSGSGSGILVSDAENDRCIGQCGNPPNNVEDRPVWEECMGSCFQESAPIEMPTRNVIMDDSGPREGESNLRTDPVSECLDQCGPPVKGDAVFEECANACFGTSGANIKSLDDGSDGFVIQRSDLAGSGSGSGMLLKDPCIGRCGYPPMNREDVPVWDECMGLCRGEQAMASGMGYGTGRIPLDRDIDLIPAEMALPEGNPSIYDWDEGSWTAEGGPPRSSIVTSGMGYGSGSFSSFDMGDRDRVTIDSFSSGMGYGSTGGSLPVFMDEDTSRCVGQCGNPPEMGARVDVVWEECMGSCMGMGTREMGTRVKIIDSFSSGMGYGSGSFASSGMGYGSYNSFGMGYGSTGMGYGSTGMGYGSGSFSSFGMGYGSGSFSSNVLARRDGENGVAGPPAQD